MEFVVVFIVGLLCGCAITYLVSKNGSIGDLRIDTSDPDDNPYLFLELSKSIDVIKHKKYVTLKVNTNSYIPHE